MTDMIWTYRGKPVSELTDAECRGVLASVLLLLQRERENRVQEKEMADLFHTNLPPRAEPRDFSKP